MTEEVLRYYEEVGFFGLIGLLIVVLIVKSWKPILKALEKVFERWVRDREEAVTESVKSVFMEFMNHMKQETDERHEFMSKRMEQIEQNDKQRFEIMQAQIDQFKEQNIHFLGIMGMHIEELKHLTETIQKHDELIEDLSQKIENL